MKKQQNPLKRFKISIDAGVYLVARSKKEADKIWQDEILLNVLSSKTGQSYPSDIWSYEVFELKD